MAQVPPHRLSQVGIGILVLIIVRCLAEVFRLQYVHGANLPIAEILPYVGSALATALVLAAALVGQTFGYYRAVTGGVCATVLALLIYKIAFMG
jgi:hypothetical protein